MHRISLAFVLAVAACATACSARSHDGGQAANPTPAALAHIDVHGVVALSHDATVKECYVGKPGTKLLNGYSVSFESDALIDGGEILIPDYARDGTYDTAAVILNVAQGPGFPHGTTLEERPQTVVTVTISNGGRAGTARFTDYRSIYGRNGDVRGGMVSGSITWTCAAIARG